MATLFLIRVGMLAATGVVPLVALDSEEGCLEEIEDKMIEYSFHHHDTEVTDMLRSFDGDADGRLTTDEVVTAMKAAGVEPNCLIPELVIKQFDLNKDGTLKHSEL
eukprot:TRINITY_DN79537_c0_g1_i1.p1 TRINITY_DN79537_c0_g1~~TRINITY_DN79537_c0_g1_i1.p1  ORF type:complete len:120 (-),score=25.64 TRINITY_DN79537_c0_g1_i1:55-372(-)